MARQTRSERRARRAAQQDSQAVAQRSRPPRQQQLRPTAEPAPADGGRHLPGSGFRNFVAESWGELKKVDWPGQSQVIQATVVVLIACIVVGIYLYVNDLIWKPVVQKIIGQ